MSYVAPLPVEAAGEIKYEDAVRLAVAGANGDETKLAKLKKTLDRAKFMREIAKENILHEAVYGDDSNGYKKTFDARYGEINRQRELRGELLKKYVPNPVVYFDRAFDIYAKMEKDRSENEIQGPDDDSSFCASFRC